MDVHKCYLVEKLGARSQRCLCTFLQTNLFHWRAVTIPHVKIQFEGTDFIYQKLWNMSCIMWVSSADVNKLYVQWSQMYLYKQILMWKQGAAGESFFTLRRVVRMQGVPFSLCDVTVSCAFMNSWTYVSGRPYTILFINILGP